MGTDILNEYFSWLTDIVCKDRFAEENSYSKLLSYLHNTEFTWLIPKDENRAMDGIALRRRFALQSGYGNYIVSYLDGPCSVLEMMIALALRCEEDITDDPSRGNRTGQWFWGMIVNLGLGSMLDRSYDEEYVANVVDIFLRRKYSRNGAGGLFTIKDCDRDLRKIEIWWQLCWYLDSIY